MKIQIIENQSNIVRVSTEIGCFNGIWCSPTPIVSKKYIVELDSDNVLTSDEVELSNSCIPCIEEFEKAIFVTGLVEEIQDNIMFLRLQKSLIMLAISCELDFVQYVGCYVRIRLSEIKLYDTGIICNTGDGSVS